MRRHLNSFKGRLWCWALVSESVALSILCWFLPLLDPCLGSQPSFSYMLSYYRVNARVISFISAVSFVFIILFCMVVVGNQQAVLYKCVVTGYRLGPQIRKEDQV